MKLTKEKIQEWKHELNRKMSEYNLDNYAETQNDSECIADYEGLDTDEAVQSFLEAE